jgi:membrane dipeptidase
MANVSSERERRLHREAIVIDAHSDILNPVVDGITSMETVWSAAEMERWRAIVPNQPTGAANVPYEIDGFAAHTAPAGQYELPLLEQGGVTAQCVAVYIHDNYLEVALERALEMVAALGRHVAKEQERCVLATTVTDIRRAKREGRVAYVLTFEGAEPVGRRLDLLEIFARLGLRMTTLTHSRRNLLADGTQHEIEAGGLTRLGKEAVQRCQELGIVLDLAHLSDRGFWDVIEMDCGPVVCSHTSLLKRYPGYRSPWDEVNPTYGLTKAQAIAKTGGVIGVIFWSTPDIRTLVAEIEAGIDQMGAEHVGLGSDLFGFAQAPRDLSHMGQLPKLTAALVAGGFDDETILGILGRNFLRVFERVWH